MAIEVSTEVARKIRSMRRKFGTPRHTRSLLHVLAAHFPLDAELIGAELGVEEGRTAEAMLQLFPHCTLHAIDCWRSGGMTSNWSQVTHDNNLLQTLLRIRPHRDRVDLMVGDTLEMVNRLAPGSLDFVFLDANHETDAVARDLEICWPRLTHGGLLIAHDYGGCGDGTRRFGVKPAVDAFVAAKKLTGFDRDYNLCWIPKP